MVYVANLTLQATRLINNIYVLLYLLGFSYILVVLALHHSKELFNANFAIVIGVDLRDDVLYDFISYVVVAILRQQLF